MNIQTSTPRSNMLAAHRDQENLVYSHQVPTKQAPKTPGHRYPKTPSGFGRRDENALGTVAGKGAVGEGKSFVKGFAASQNAMTPMAPQARAVLGDKTTNAKARTGQGKAAGAKDLDKSQMRQSSVRKQRARPASSRKLFLATAQDAGPDHDEPEYAPPRPKDLPYQSDVLPKGGLSFDGIKKGSLLKGFYHHFHDAVDAHGMSRNDRLFNDEMVAVLEEAVQWNIEQEDGLTWNIDDIPEELHGEHEVEQSQGTRARHETKRRDPSISSRHAAAALAIQAPSRDISTPTARSTVSGDMVDPSSNTTTGTTIGEAASRTSIGYAKGRSTSNVLHPREEMNESFSARAKRVVPIMDGIGSPLTTTPSLSRAVAYDAGPEDAECSRPAFMSIFDGHYDDLDLPGIPVPLVDSDEEEEFELRVDL